MYITLEMLQTLASPNVTAQNEVQAYLSTLDASQRLAGLVEILQKGNAEYRNDAPPHLLQLAAILLRREIIALDDTVRLQALVDPLLQILHNRSLTCGGTTGTTRNGSLNVVNVAIGNCLAEICANLDSLHDVTAPAVVSHILNHSFNASANTGSTGSTCPCMALWTTVAERSPHAFARSNVWQHLSLLFSNTTVAGSTSRSSSIANELKLLMAAALAVGNSTGNTCTDRSENEHMHHPVRAMGRHYFTPLLLRLMQQANVDDEIWTLLVQLAEDVPDLLGVHGDPNSDVGRVLNWCATTLSNPNPTTLHCRLSAVQVVLSLLSHFRIAQNLSSHQQVLSMSVQTCWNILSVQNEDDVWEDNDVWAAEPTTLHDNDTASGILFDDNGASDHAEALLGDLLRHAPSTTLSVLLPLVQDALQSDSTLSSNDDQRRLERRQCAAWLALSCSLEVVPMAMSPHVAFITNAALAAANAGSTGRQLRVVYCAVRLLGLVCEGTSTATLAVPSSLGSPHDDAATTMTALWTAMLQQLTQSSQHACTKIAALACQALVSYCRPCLERLHEKDGPRQHPARAVLLAHLPCVLQALVAGPLSLDKLGSFHTLGTIVVQIRATGAVACIAQVAGSAFAPYYSSVMPNLLAKAAITINHAHQEPHRKCDPSYEMQQLAGSSLEAATMIGQAVSLRNDNDGQDASHLFTASDAHQIMQWAVAALERPNEQWWPMDLLLAACARVASVLEVEYAPYVDRVLPHLLARATDPSDVEFVVRE
jgi:hypothetical protein